MNAIGYANIGDAGAKAPSLDGDIRTAMSVIHELTMAVADLHSRVCGSFPTEASGKLMAAPEGWAKDVGGQANAATSAAREALSDIHRIREALGI